MFILQMVGCLLMFGFVLAGFSAFIVSGDESRKEEEREK